MLNFFTNPTVTEKIYREYVNTGEVPKKIITMLAKKVIQNKKLNSQEYAIFCGLTTEINAEICIISKN